MKCEIRILSGRKDFTGIIFQISEKGNSISKKRKPYCAETLRPHLGAALLHNHQERRKPQRRSSTVHAQFSPKSSADFYPKLHLQGRLKKTF